MLHRWKVLSTKLAFDNPWFKVRQDVVELPSGQVMDDYFMWENKEVVMAVAVTQRLDVSEEIEVNEYTPTQIETMIHDGTIVTTGTISAFTLARKRLGL